MKNQLLLIVTMIMLFANCIYGQNFVPVTRSNSGQSIQLSKDQVLEVRLPSQPSTGYGWYVVNTSNNNELYKKENVNNGIIKQIGNREFVSDEKSIDIVGAPGTQVLRFVGVSKGTTDLKLVYVRPWLKDAEPLDVYKIKIVNDGVYTGTYKPAEPLTVTADESNSAPKGATAIPTNFSWLDQGGCSPVKDQAQCGSCWDFAAMGCFEAAIKIVDFNTRDISEQWLINCSGQSGCQGGNCPFSYIKSYGGAVYESDLPYADAACNVTNTAATCIGTCGTYTHHEKITSYGSAGSSYTDYTNLKTSIYNYGPIWVTVEADGAAFNAYSGGILTTSDGTSVDHAVVLVGWNDTGGYWIMRNSWGTSWGENGYARIKYGVDKLGGSATYLTYGTISHTLAPRAAFGAATTTLNCHVQSIQFSDSSQNAPTSWLWNFGDNTTSTLQNPTHTYTASGTYTVSYTATNAYGNSTATKTNYITINLPASPTATGATSTGGSVTLTASGNGTLYWFDSPTGSTVLKKGTSYATPVLTKTDTFYVESVISHTAATVGKASSTLSTSTGGYYTSTGVNGEIFDAYEPLTIKSVTVYASKATNRTIYLKNSSGTVLDSLVTNVNGTSSVNLNFHVPVGAGYLLEGGISNYLWRETSGASYPYSISNVMSITGSTAGSGYYYYFYNWRVLEDSCYSARVPAIATLSVPASVNISANPSGAICAGTNVTFTAAPINGGANPTYQWQNNGMNISGATNATYTSSSLANSDVITCIMTSNASGVTGSPATSNSITMTVNPIITAGVSITANPSGAICVGTNVTFTAIPTNGGSTPTYQWQKNGVNISGATSATYTSSSLANGDVISCIMTSNASSCMSGTVSSNLITMTVNGNISIAANPSGAICFGTGVTFTATSIGGDSTATYQWQNNGVNISGATNMTYSSSSLANGDMITCVLTSSSNSCFSGPLASNSVMMTVNSGLPASVSIAASPSGAICAGSNVTFTAIPANGGTAPTYQWQKNGIAISGAISSIYASSSLVNNDSITCIMTSSASCVSGSPATSNLITMTVNSSLPASVSIAASPSGAICSGTSVTYTATPTNGGSSPTYQWKNNGIAISGATSATYTSSSLANGNIITCVMTSTATCATGSPATSNSITITVNLSVAASVSIAASPSGTISSGTIVTFTATPTNGGSTPTYQWKNNGIAISGATSVTYTSSSLVNGNIITCVMTSSASCVSGSPATSNAITMTVTTVSKASVSITANPSGAICSGTSVKFTATPTNGGTTPKYQWKKNGTSISGATSSTYTSTSLANGNTITCVMTSNLSGVTGSPATSNSITMAVNSNVTASVKITASPSGTIKSGTSVIFTATPTNGGTAPTYQWKKNGTAISGATSSTYTSTTLANGNKITCVMTSNAPCETGSPATSNSITMKVTSSSTPNGNNEVGEDVNISADPNCCFELYPNPAIDNITVEIQQQATIEILSIEGQLIKSISSSDNKTNIDVSALPKGMYVVEVKTENGIKMKKFIKE